MPKNASFLVLLIFLGVFAAVMLPGLINSIVPADWVFYRHAESGLSFSYPPTASFHAQGRGAYFIHRPEGQPESITLYFLQNVEHYSLSDFIVAHAGGLFNQPDTTFSRTDVFWDSQTFWINWLPAIRLSRNESTRALVGMGKYTTFTAKDNWVVAITLGTGGRNPADDDWEPTATGQRIYDVVVSSVKFLP